jgi:DNA-binding NarL/FixJ family response regulator
MNADRDVLQGWPEEQTEQPSTGQPTCEAKPGLGEADMTRILIADDHGMVRQGLQRILAAEFPGALFGEAGTVAETLAFLDRESWNLLLLDIFMPGGGGLEVLRRAASTYPRLRVLVLSSAPEEQMASRALRAGASGYLAKQATAEELVAAVHKILAGGRYISQKLAEHLAASFARPSESPHEGLSDREFQVLQLLIAGQSLKQIAAGLSLSPKTVSTFHSRILTKLHLQNNVELIHYALDHRLAEQAPAPRCPSNGGQTGRPTES